MLALALVLGIAIGLDDPAGRTEAGAEAEVDDDDDDDDVEEDGSVSTRAGVACCAPPHATKRNV